MRQSRRVFLWGSEQAVWLAILRCNIAVFKRSAEARTQYVQARTTALEYEGVHGEQVSLQYFRPSHVLALEGTQGTDTPALRGRR